MTKNNITKASFEKSLSELKERCAALADTDKSACAPHACAPHACWARNPHGSAIVINENERVSLRAMIAYVAHATRRSEYRVERELSDAFCVANVTCLPAAQYERALHLLAEQIDSAA